jgi:hypothetical protein
MSTAELPPILTPAKRVQNVRFELKLTTDDLQRIADVMAPVSGARYPEAMMAFVNN